MSIFMLLNFLCDGSFSVIDSVFGLMSYFFSLVDDFRAVLSNEGLDNRHHLSDSIDSVLYVSKFYFCHIDPLLILNVRCLLK